MSSAGSRIAAGTSSAPTAPVSSGRPQTLFPGSLRSGLPGHSGPRSTHRESGNPGSLFRIVPTDQMTSEPLARKGGSAMKRYFLFPVLAIALLAPSAFAVDKEVIQLQQSVALLQGMVRELQRNFDEKTAVMRTLIEQSSGQMSQLTSDLSSLQQSIQTTVGSSGQRLESVGLQVQGIQSSIDDLRARLDNLSQQVSKMESSSQNISSSIFSGSTDPGMGTPPAPDVLYNTALRDYTSGNYPLALQEFLEYLRYYPNTALASNAQFYIGDIYYQQGQFEKAVQEYDKAIEQYPDGNKTAAAQLKKGFALINLNLRTQGMQELDAVVKNFPNTPEAQLARDKLATQPGGTRPATR
jgi:tol-pal system protein YbgF